jgi:hypothetical protein
MEEQRPEPIAPAPVLPYGGGPTIACPYCGCPQFFPQKKLGTAGFVVLIVAICLTILSTPCLLLGYVGLCPIAASLLMACFGFVLMLAIRRTVNRCGRCGRSF